MIEPVYPTKALNYCGRPSKLIPQMVRRGMQKYRKPPIIERALVVHATIPEEELQLRTEEWAQKVQEDFPHPETVTEWTFALLDKKGMPTQGAARQKLSLRPAFWKMHGAQKHKGIQVWTDKVALNLLGIPGDPHHFEDLMEMADRWIPVWAQHFGITRHSGVTLEYVNRVSTKTMPEFSAGTDFMVSEILEPFRHLPNPGRDAKLVHPLDLQLHFQIPDSLHALHVFIRCIMEAVENASLQARISVSTHAANQEFPLNSIPNQIQAAHSLILSEFDALFTVKAKNSFQPYDDDSHGQ